MTNEQFCHIYTQFFGERIDNIKQIVTHTFNGEELKEFVEFALKQEQSETPPNTEKRDQFGIKGISKKPCDMCIYNKRTNLQICVHCTDNNEIQEYYKSKR